jgi:hypothetical protein
MVLLQRLLYFPLFFLSVNYLQVRNNEADIGVSIFGCSQARSTVVICSVATHFFSEHWYSKAPGKLPSEKNLIRIFTYLVWLLIFLSMALFGVFLLIAAKVGTYYGIITETYEDFLVSFR